MAGYEDIMHGISSGKYSPVYFLQGDEPFFIDNIIDQLEMNVLDEAQKSFNQYVFYGKETDFTTLLGTARKYPMMGELQVVIVKEAQELKGWNKEENQSLLLNYLEHPVPSTILAFAFKYKSLDKRTRLSKELEKLAVVLHSKKIYDNQLPNWIQSYARARNVTLSQKAVILLSENIGTNLQRQANEIEKLLINVKEGTEIDDQAVHRYVGISKDYNVFELQKAMSYGNFPKALRIVNYFSANPSNHPMVLILANLFTYFTRILQAHLSPQKDRNTLAKVIGINPFFADEIIKALKQFTFDHVLRNIQLLHEADLRSKGVDYNMSKEKGFLPELIYRLMHYDTEAATNHK